MSITPVLPNSTDDLTNVAVHAPDGTVGDFVASPASCSGDQARTIDKSVVDACIMVVDHDPQNVESVVEQLSRCGFRNFVTTCEPQKTLELVHETKPDLLLDIVMPQMSGLDILQQIRASEQTRYLPVIILTRCSNLALRRQALERGAADLLAEPVDSQELALRIRGVLNVKSYQDDLLKYAQQLEGDVRHKNEALVEARQEADYRYFAGKAEIATDVLHNVGNALNSINVAVDLVRYTLGESRVPALKRVSGLLLANTKSIGKFMKKDKRGRVLPSYLDELADALEKERQCSLTEIELLKKHLEHIKAVVATQQKYARLCNVMEPTSLSELVDDAEELVGSSLSKHGVKIVRGQMDVPPVRTDKQKVLQVLVNVLKNAIESSTEANQQGMARVEVQLGTDAPNHVSIEVRDNGVGIAKENMAKIFTHGFTTKKQGNGFGLHSCANIMKELGGTIHAHSDGPQTGATFALRLPLERRSERAQK